MATLTSTALMDALRWKYAASYSKAMEQYIVGVSPSTETPYGYEVSRDYTQELGASVKGLTCLYCTAAWHDDGSGRCCACGAPYGERNEHNNLR